MKSPGLPGGKTCSKCAKDLLGAVAAADVLDDFDDLHFLVERVGGKPLAPVESSLRVSRFPSSLMRVFDPIDR